MSALLTPGTAQAHHFLAVLSGGEAVTFQTFSDSDTPKKVGPNGQIYDPNAGWRHGTFEHLEPWLGNANRRGAGVFVLINAGNGRGRKAENVRAVRALFIDTDGAPYPTDLPLEPHLVVESSPNKWHLYWLVNGLELADFGPLQGALAELYGTDPYVKDLPRVMRLPGFYHRKAEPVMVELLEANDRPPYAPADVFTAWPVLAAKRDYEQALVREQVQRQGLHGWSHLLDDPTRRREAGRLLLAHHNRVADAAPGTRHSTLRGSAYALGGYVATGCVSEDEAAGALRDAASACGLPDAEAEGVIQWGLTNGAKRPLDLTLPLPQNLHTKGAALTRWGRLSNRLKEWNHARH